MFFDPERCRNRILEQYNNGPSAVSLGWYSNLLGTSEITCVNSKGKDKILYVPKQFMRALRRFRVDLTATYVVLRVSLKKEDEPKFWLVWYVFHRSGYRLPKSAFNDKGEYQPTRTERAMHEME